MKAIIKSLFVLVAALIFSSCGVYRQHIMLKVDEDKQYAALARSAELAYELKPFDRFTLKVYSNKGELIIDPDYSLRREIGNIQGQSQLRIPEYTIEEDSSVVLPMIGRVDIGGMTLFMARNYLAEQYQEFYKEVYVTLNMENRRVIVLGGLESTVIPLTNENMSLLEVIALSGGINERSKAHNIRLVRGDLNNPQVEVIDLSTIEGMSRANLAIEPGDIVYIEPVQMVWRDALKDIAPFLSLVTTLASLGILVFSLNN